MKFLISCLFYLCLALSNPEAACEPFHLLPNNSYANDLPNLAVSPGSNPPSGIFTDAISVILSSPSTDIVYYTVDGTNPSSYSYLYTGPFDVNSSTEVRAIAWCGDYQPPSPVSIFSFQFNVLPINLAPRVTNTLGMTFALTPARSTNEPFYMGTHEVTQAQWSILMTRNPSVVQNAANPVENMSWNEALKFVAALNAYESTDRYRLPTLAEWFHAARGGYKTRYSFGDDPLQLRYYACFHDMNVPRHLPYLKPLNETGFPTHPQEGGHLLPNAWGLYDVQGNLREWLFDMVGQNEGTRLIANCSYLNMAAECELNMVSPAKVTYSSHDTGFRVLMDVE